MYHCDACDADGPRKQRKAHKASPEHLRNVQGMSSEGTEGISSEGISSEGISSEGISSEGISTEGGDV